MMFSRHSFSVGANSFARPAIVVRMNSHLRPVGDLAGMDVEMALLGGKPLRLKPLPQGLIFSVGAALAAMPFLRHVIREISACAGMTMLERG